MSAAVVLAVIGLCAAWHVGSTAERWHRTGRRTEAFALTLGFLVWCVIVATIAAGLVAREVTALSG